jgi:tripartite-type tricarboxylate transporter receptor subunit TctC
MGIDKRRQRSAGGIALDISVALLLTLAPALGFGQNAYPSRTVRMIIPFAPGGASDFVGRIMQPRLGELLGQQIVVDNRGGAAGAIGTEAAARSAPDGYTIFLGNVGTLAINPAVFTKLAIHPLRDFQPITQVVDVPGVLIVNPSLAATNVKELIAYAKANPGKLNYASPGSGSQNRLEMELLRRAGGLDMVHVPYKGGAGPAVTGLIAGETQLMFTTISSALGQIKAGRLRALAVTSPKRLVELPEVPTMIESGYTGGSSGSWQGVLVPAGTPREVVDKLYTVIVETMRTPEVKARLAKGAAEAVTSESPKAFADFIAAEEARWGKVAREAGATVD